MAKEKTNPHTLKYKYSRAAESTCPELINRGKISGSSKYERMMAATANTSISPID